MERTLTSTRDVLLQLAGAGTDREALFVRAAAAVRESLGAAFGQLFTLEAETVSARSAGRVLCTRCRGLRGWSRPMRTCTLAV